MKLALAWLLGALAGAAGAYAYNQHTPSLPYTEPHHEFLSNDGADCAAWRFTNGAVFILCEGIPPVLVSPKRECGLKL